MGDSAPEIIEHTLSSLRLYCSSQIGQSAVKIGDYEVD